MKSVGKPLPCGAPGVTLNSYAPFMFSSVVGWNAAAAPITAAAPTIRIMAPNRAPRGDSASSGSCLLPPKPEPSITDV